MWKKCKESLTLRVFLLSFGLVLLACAAVGGLVVSLAPVSHAALLENRLEAQLDALSAKLESSDAEESARLLVDFVSGSTARVSLLDAEGNVLFIGSAPRAAAPEAATPAGTALQEDDVTQVVTTVEGSTCGMAFMQQDAACDDGQILVMDQVSVAEYTGSRPVRLADGTDAVLTLSGSMAAVGQTALALRGLLPYLALVALGLALVAAFVFARFVTRPVVALSRIAGSMAAQRFDVRWQGRRSDEIGALGESLNRLSVDLSAALDQLRQSNAALEKEICREKELEKQRSTFFAAASHELKTPVTILKGQLSGMLEQIGPYRDRDRYLARSLAVTQRMEELIRELLTISRLEAGECGMAQVELSALAERLLEENRELAESKEIAVEAELEQGITVRGNEALLRNVLDNLLMNGLLYSPPGERLRVVLRQGCLRVENTGVTLPEEVLPHLFEPFYRVEGSRNRASGGSGLGLYLVSCIAKQHGMRTQVSNTADGVCFQLLWGAEGMS